MCLIALKIPLDATLCVKKNDFIDFSTTLYTINKKTLIAVHVAEILSISPNEIFKAVSFCIGDYIEKNKVLAIKKSFLKSKKVFSPVSGIIRNISHTTGEVIIEKEDEIIEKQKSYVIGKVYETKPKTGELVIELEKAIELKASEVNQDFGGQLVILDEKNKILSEENIKNCVFVSHSFSSIEISKLDALGASGIITTKLREKISIPYAKISILGDFNKILLSKKKYIVAIKSSFSVYCYDSYI